MSTSAPARRPATRLVALAAAALSAVVLLTGIPRSASAAPATPDFPATIDAYAPNQPQTSCRAAAQDGTMALRDMLNKAYGKHSSGMTRGCDVGGTSEHKDGRALDYMLNINNATEKAVAEDILDWLLATDRWGNKHANARRLGIMYLIWDRQIWASYRASEGGRPYSGASPHRDHIHFSLSWDGALQKTTWWTLGNKRAHGTQWGRNRTAAGAWDAHAEKVDANTNLISTATAATPDGRLHTVNVVPNSGVWYRSRSAAGAWDGSAQKIDENGKIISVALAARPNGTLDIFAVVPGSGVWHRSKPSGGAWNGSATKVDANGDLTRVAATALPNGSLHYAGLLPGSGIWTRSWTSSGGWDDSATKVDENPEIAAIALAGRSDNTLHLFGVVPDSGIWYRPKTGSGWAGNATKIDDNDSINAVAVTGGAGGRLHLTGVVSGSGVWYRGHNGSAWDAHATKIDDNNNIFATSIAGLPNGSVYVANLVDVS